jgi:cyclopropane-fatty-acyl-phospholipid synthase
LCRAFIQGQLEVEGDVETVVHAVRARAAESSSLLRMARVAVMAARLPRASGTRTGERGLRRRRRVSRRHSRRRDAAAIQHHYDVGNGFYRLWLDRRSIYSSAYFAPGVEDLDQAQEAKLDRICRQLELHPSERLLDIGCGWGGLIRYASRRYAVEATGITLSPSQAELATSSILEDGLGDRCRVEIRDYRDLPEGPAFDKASSIGMFEHVGRSRLREYFTVAYRVLRPGGLFVNTGIISLEDARTATLGVRIGAALRRTGQFLQRYIFPDGELLPLSEVIAAAEGAGFETRSVESMREHYMRTVRHWIRRLEAHRREAVAQVGEATYRAWRLYLAGSADAFATGRIGMVELVLSKPGGRSEPASSGPQRVTTG